MLEFTVSKSFDRVTHESAEHGDFAEHGYEFENETLSFGELMRELRSYYALSGDIVSDHYLPWPVSWPEENFETGESTTYSLHINAINGKLPTAHQLRRIFKAAGLLKEAARGLQPLVLYARDFTEENVKFVKGPVNALKLETVSVPYYATSEAEPEFSPYLKLTVSPSKEGTVVSLYRHAETDEGWEAEGVQIEQEPDRWLITSRLSASDCDGQLQHGRDCASSGAPRKNYDNTFFPTMRDASELIVLDDWQRDPVAEAARY